MIISPNGIYTFLCWYIKQFLTPTPLTLYKFFKAFLIISLTPWPFNHLLPINFWCSRWTRQWSMAHNRKQHNNCFLILWLSHFPPLTWCTVMTDGYLPKACTEAYKVLFWCIPKTRASFNKVIWYKSHQCLC